MDGSDPKALAHERIAELHEPLIGLSHWIHANPEVQFEETLASGWLGEWLDRAGFDVERALGGLETAIVGRYGSGDLHVAVFAEYDALPGVGHACGHNVIAAAGVGAGIALASVADEVGLTVSVFGTPAEEGGGGKIRLLDAGTFEGVHAALMVHPYPVDFLEPTVLAAQSIDVSYSGKEAHASAFPELGVNASDAIVIAQVAIGLLRQQLEAGDRVHGIVTRGGDAPNVIPARVEARWMIRAASLDGLGRVRDRVLRCFEAGAIASGASLDVEPRLPYAEMRHDSDLAALYRANAEQLGRTFAEPGSPGTGAFSTDMGNVSLAIPSIHPMIGIGSLPAVNHQPEFAAACVSPAADQAIFDGAVALAWTAIDAARDENVRQRLLALPAATAVGF